ncbi:hypothetical protein L227DRAFT_604157 [Lentinus tigrinus ALCF2SS1-6]|uniref:Heterokaryon incompatibility domain-containing protein n=1 Tax=Lentinus tigrinus ALCF2SS1-6 TaxID=1328759 RepID=A0A5C2RT52_9APHY|nr:hypothetical protein L227DRAFT_604157 [Lentinus tigrinus ALCF2SS1-6]
MARTYKEAASVLVIDTGIQTQCSTSSTVSNYLFRISLSGWMHRVWTLQEGLLARRLYFEFGGGAIVDVEKILAIHKGVIQLVAGGALQHAERRMALEQYLLDHAIVESLPVSDAFLSAYIPRGFISPEETERLVSLFGYRRRALSSGISTTLEDAIVLLHNRSTSHEEDETIAIAGLFPGKVNVEALLDIKDSSSSATSLRRMEAFLIQLGEVPKELPWLPLSVDRLHRLNFRWAPATLTSVGSSFSGATFFRTASCTADGLRGKYVVGRLPTAILIPDRDDNPPPDGFFTSSFQLAHEGCAYEASLRIRPQALRGLRFMIEQDGHRHVEINSILLQDDPFPQQMSNSKYFAAVQVVEGGGDGIDESGPIHYTYVASGRIEPIEPLFAEAMLADRKKCHELADVSQTHVLLS